MPECIPEGELNALPNSDKSAIEDFKLESGVLGGRHTGTVQRRQKHVKRHVRWRGYCESIPMEGDEMAVVMMWMRRVVECYDVVW